MAPLCKLAGVSTRLVVTERAGHAQHMLQVSAFHGDDCGGDCCGDRGGGGVDISRHAQLMLQVSDPHEGDCGGDCGGNAC